ncbi:MAG: hypothetical protein JWP91_4123 [Fibrobacteres bacterium]|nr:hypothetical protein [Fibrobacterota bacterium]
MKEARLSPDASHSASDADEAAAQDDPSLHRFDGFYLDRTYYQGLKRSLSIFATKFPSGSVYLQIHGSAIVTDYNNHEGGAAILKAAPDSAALKDPGSDTSVSAPFIAVRAVNDSVLEAWEAGKDAGAEFLKMGEGIGTIYDVYGGLILDGVYACTEKGACRDTVVIKGDSIEGLPAGKRKLDLAIDWLDNMPQMDFFDLAAPGDSLRFAFKASKDRLDLFDIILPKDCKSFQDYDCPLVDAKRGRKVLALKRIQGGK